MEEYPKSYAKRNRILRQLGFESYEAYLESPLWKSIRLRVLKRDRWKCFGCRGSAWQVHHRKYTYANLSGRDTHGLSAVCGTCHAYGEFKDGKKLSPKQATKRIYRVTSWLKSQERASNPQPRRAHKPPKPLSDQERRDREYLASKPHFSPRKSTERVFRLNNRKRGRGNQPASSNNGLPAGKRQRPNSSPQTERSAAKARSSVPRAIEARREPKKESV